ncbi:MAG TPA: RyR domain-containing protein [Blastocatellia bacterium]|nr:RyR domain-containing protein [Blastocatellia bacterium]
MYQPKPIDSSQITLPEEIRELTEKLAASAHDHWALGRMREGWTYGPQRNDELKQHPGLVPYDELTESEKEYDRTTAMETLRAIYALGYRIIRD